MKSKTFTLNIASFLLLFLSTPTLAQNKCDNSSTTAALATLNLITLINSNSNKSPNQAFEGKMTLKTGDVVNGFFSLNNPIYNDEYVVIHHTETEKSYFTDTIESITFNNVEAPFKTIYKSVNGSSNLLREVHNGKNGIVYDSSTDPFRENLFGPIYVKKKNKLINTEFFWSSGPKHDLIRYVRNKDGVRYKRKEFNSLQDVYAKL